VLPESFKTPPASLERIVLIAYLLHFFSALNGLLTPAFIVTAFLSGWPSIIALVMCYIWRDDAQHTYLSSHFDWLIRTFWYTAVWLVIACVFIVTIVGMVIGLPILLFVGVWVLYRLLKGVFALNGRRVVL
jgi:uncharacterized membrane protein